MPDQHEIARVRLERAGLHIEEFRTKSVAFIDSGVYEVFRQQETEGEKTFLVLKLRITKDIPTELAIVFGECANQLRTICDNLFYGLFVDLIPDALLRREKPKFPILEDRTAPQGGGRDDFAKWRTRYAAFPADLLDYFERLQPFNDYTRPHGPSSGPSHPLAVLHHLWNEDKHQMPLEVAGINVRNETIIEGDADFDFGLLRKLMDGGNLFAGMTAGTAPVRDAPINNNAGLVLHDGMELSSVEILPGKPVPDIKAKIAVEIIPKEQAILCPGRSAYQLLIELHKFVGEEVVNGLIPFLP